MNRLIPAVVAIVAAVLAALFIAPAAPALGSGHTGDPELAARTRAVIDDTDGLRGLAVALIEDGRVRLAGLGRSDNRAAAGEPVNADTAFEPGSVTKTWTGMLLADMIEAGDVRTTDTLGTLLPGRAFADPAVREITVEELASHRSGLPALAPRDGLGTLGSVTASMRGADPYAGVDRDDVLDAVSRIQLPNSKGTLRYSNFGMAVLGHALAERTGTPYARLVTERVLAPVGMSSTVFRPDGAAPPPTAATGGTAAGRTVDPWTGSGYLPAGIGDWTTARDLATFLAATMDGTAPGSAATTPRFREDDASRIGYAWFTTRYGHREITWHNGATGGFSAYVAYEPATGRGVVVLGNTDRSVDPIGLALLGVTEGPHTAVEGTKPILVGLTLVLLVGALGPAGTLTVGGRSRWWPAPDRLRVVAGVTSAAGSLAVAHALGAWRTVPGLAWTVAFGILAGTVALAAVRWRALPTVAGKRPAGRWAGTVVTAAIGAALVVAAVAEGANSG
jgi:CubicO group peptidase (beta-lactamase class C family)